MVTVVITSFNRFDLLKRTIDSFMKFNTYPIEDFIIIEDSGSVLMKGVIENYLFSLSKLNSSLIAKFTFIFNETNIGLIQSIDKAYAEVKTPYVFHSEDDYEYYREGFIERSLAVLEHDKLINNVWIRRLDDTTGMPHEEPLLYAGDVPYYLIGHNPTYEWHGFCFQCGLRSMEAYNKVKPYDLIAGPEWFITAREQFIGDAYFNLGYRAAILPEGYTNHIGFMRSTFGLFNK